VVLLVVSLRLLFQLRSWGALLLMPTAVRVGQTAQSTVALEVVSFLLVRAFQAFQQIIHGVVDTGDLLMVAALKTPPERFLPEAAGHTLEALLPLVCMAGMAVLTQ
jgi:hypothetical protein